MFPQSPSAPTSSITPDARRYDFRAALASIPLSTRWVHHGRDIEKDGGLDCLGFVLAVYKGAGLDMAKLDLPYAKGDADKKHRVPLLIRQIEKQFRFVHGLVPQDCRDGDLLIIGPGRDNHIAVVVNNCAAEMAMPRVGNRSVRLHRLNTVWSFVSCGYRHKSLW